MPARPASATGLSGRGGHAPHRTPMGKRDHRERNAHRECKDPAPMQIRPEQAQDRQRDQSTALARSQIPRKHEDRRQDKGHIERLGSRRPQRQRDDDRDKDQGGAAQRRDTRRRQVDQLPDEPHDDRRHRQDQEARPGRPARPPRAREEHVPQPAVRHERLPGRQPAERLGRRDAAPRDDRVPDREMPPGVGVDLRSPRCYPRRRRARRQRGSLRAALRRATTSPSAPSSPARW